MARLRRVNWKEKTEEAKKALELHNSSNYLKIILENYFLYNSYARADIAKLLNDHLQTIRKNGAQSKAVQKNIFLEIYSKYIQVSEDLALVGNLLLNSKNKEINSLSIYMESNNSDILSFYKRAYAGFSDKEIKKIMGIDKLFEYIKSAQHLSKEEIVSYESIISESIKIEKNNLKMLAKLYIEEFKNEKGDNQLIQAGPIDVYNGIKHGYKVVYPTKLAKSLWTQITEDSVDVMHQVVEDESTGQKIIILGGFGEINDDIINSIMFNIEHFSEELHLMCEIRLWSEKDPMFVIKRFRLTKTEEELKKKKINVNDKCPCGSGIKYKRCCKFFKYEYDKIDPYSIVDI